MSYYDPPSGYYNQSPNQRSSYATSQQQPYAPYASSYQGYPILQRRPQQQPPPQQYYSSPSTSPGSIYSQPQSPPCQPVQSTPGYHCLYPNCTHTTSRKTDLERHCDRTGRYGFSTKDKMVDHMRQVHEADIPKKRRSSGRR
ncbi:unnamed protein product [Zymoseptoria tritici ST99CH_3D1]|uniref:Uncharacterized protein n=1 Tax=Zymoseptoria tritici (strain CBS 115943 / IPO323) TaxID=336722 RepID=F9WZV6_ZYMTI|nr:uncharacterized protein MYCGRDRAFT_89015 [Zymoseptoria tritici IPO323]EGP91039.1 hypothetical protein MYCGRDRAFT_89015 [Zymoseptoria tritici IPO323]SMR43938.1 unnamed protein product [Zymoseptoria tritici ST99CH_3D1]